MRSAGPCDGELFTENYCNICNAQLISESQRIAHYESKKHANKVRLFYMLHPEDGGPPSKRLRPDDAVGHQLLKWLSCSPPFSHLCTTSPFTGNKNSHPAVRKEGSDETEVDRNKCCTLCNMFFTSAIVAQSHYQGKTHAKRIRLVLGAPPAVAPSPPDSSSTTPPPPAPPWPLACNGEAGKYCCLCGAWFNNPLMARQHYEGKKHKRNAARARLLEQLAGSLGATESVGLRSSYSCGICNMILNSIEQYHAHLQGSKHQNNLKQHQH